ncbi:hypothetical protein G6011_05471 [Alternaria panax]|uniref:Uncharacterized protein n=1 Tax=Alternaria panax TaxID=48097 RepID=A0AAD4FCP8_9PLEO|nr:hypothetical protein G6011_05471 [Alternaria panax]
MRKHMGKIVAWNETKNKVTEDEFRKINTGTIVWEITAEKTTNKDATHKSFDCFSTSDGLCCFKRAPWIVEIVNKELWSYDCRKMTEREKTKGNEKLTTSQLVQAVRLLYPNGKNKSDTHNLPVLNVSWCRHRLSSDEISLASLNESKTIQATKGMLIVGELDQPPKLV